MLGTNFWNLVKHVNDTIDAWELYFGYHLGVLMQKIRGEQPVDLFLSSPDV